MIGMTGIPQAKGLLPRNFEVGSRLEHSELWNVEFA